MFISMNTVANIASKHDSLTWHINCEHTFEQCMFHGQLPARIHGLREASDVPSRRFTLNRYVVLRVAVALVLQPTTSTNGITK